MISRWALHSKEQMNEIYRNVRTSLVRSLVFWNCLLIGGFLLIFPLETDAVHYPVFVFMYSSAAVVALIASFLFGIPRALIWINRPLSRYDRWGFSDQRTAASIFLGLSIFPICLLSIVALLLVTRLTTLVFEHSEIWAALIGTVLCLAINVFFWSGLYGAEYLRIVLCRHPDIPHESGA
jgi:hypothetical protein